MVLNSYSVEHRGPRDQRALGFALTKPAEVNTADFRFAIKYLHMLLVSELGKYFNTKVNFITLTLQLNTFSQILKEY